MVDNAITFELEKAERKMRVVKKRYSGGQSRARVLSAAGRLFAKFGFESTSIRQIASELNIVTASLYHHFLTKEEMLHEILRAPLNRLAEGAIRIANEPGDPERRLVGLIVLRIQAWLEDRHAHAISINDAQFLILHEDFAYVEDSKRQGYLAMETVLRAGVDQGQFRRELDIHYAIVVIAGVLNSATRSMQQDQFHTVEPPSPVPAECLTARIVDFVLRLVRTSARIDDPIPAEWIEQAVPPV